MPSVMIVGATGGIGLALVREYAKRNWRVGLLGRDASTLAAVAAELREQYPAGTFPFESCDLRDAAILPAKFAALQVSLKEVDLVIYAAGVMHAISDNRAADFALEADMYAVNTVAAVHVLGLAAEHMQYLKRGHIAAIGSIAGERGRKGNPSYCASKAGLHTYLEGMRNRLASLGIRVSTIKPGFVNTRMLNGRKMAGAIEPADAARRIASSLERRSQTFFIPGWWALVGFAMKMCPSFVFKRLGPA